MNVDRYVKDFLKLVLWLYLKILTSVLIWLFGKLMLSNIFLNLYKSYRGDIMIIQNIKIFAPSWLQLFRKRR